jgi:biopolymer transport protein ExbD
VAPNDDRRSIVTGINVTPMIDVLLVLLVTFFLLNLPMPHINVVVPPPSAGVDGGSPHQLVLELPDAGGYRLNGQPVPDDQFDAVVHAAFDTRPVKLLFIAAGGERRYEEVVTAVDRARGAGVQVVAFMPGSSPLQTSP